MAIPDAEILASPLDRAKNEGLFLSPAGAAATAAYDRPLAPPAFSSRADRVVLFNTGSGLNTPM
jgi:threonine synthase